MFDLSLDPQVVSSELGMKFDGAKPNVSLEQKLGEGKTGDDTDDGVSTDRDGNIAHVTVHTPDG